MKEQIPEYVVGWGTLALINAGIAQGKNHSGLGWFFLSLFLGPIATLLIVVLDKREPSYPASGASARNFNLDDFRRQ